MKEAAAPRLLSAGIGGNVLSLLGMLLTVIGVLVLAYWVTRLIGRHGMPGLAKASGGRGRLEVLWQVSLGKSERLVLVRVEQRCLLLGVTSGEIRVLTELSEEEAGPWLQSPGASADTPSFLDILRDNFPKKK